MAKKIAAASALAAAALASAPAALADATAMLQASDAGRPDPPVPAEPPPAAAPTDAADPPPAAAPADATDPPAAGTADPPTASYLVTQITIRHNGGVYEPGKTIELTEAGAERLGALVAPA